MAGDVIEQLRDIQRWYLANHSLGRAIVSQLAANHPEQIDGLILGVYFYGDYSPANTLTIYGSLKQSAEDKIDYT